MPYRAQAREKGIVDPKALSLLERVFKDTSTPGESERDREARASRIIGDYLTGIEDEAELRTLARQALGR